MRVVTDIIKKKRGKNQKTIHETSGAMGRKGGKVSVQPKDQTPFLPLSGTRKVVRTPTNPFETAGTAEVFVPKEIIAQDIFAGPNKGTVTSSTD